MRAFRHSLLLSNNFAKLRRLADCLETGKQFKIQIAGERISVPAGATFNIEQQSS